MQIYHTDGNSRLAIAILVDSDTTKISAMKDLAKYDDSLKKSKKTLDNSKFSSDMEIDDLLAVDKKALNKDLV